MYFIFLSFRTSSNEIPETSIQATTLHEDEVTSSSIDEKSVSTSETDQDLRTFLNSLTTHLLPDLSTSFDEETEDESISQGDQIVDSIVQKSIEETKEESIQSQDRISKDQIETVDETK